MAPRRLAVVEILVRGTYMIRMNDVSTSAPDERVSLIGLDRSELARAVAQIGETKKNANLRAKQL